MKRFIQVTDQLFRGGAPTVEEVKILHEKFGINKIVSLDALAGKRIDRICKLLNIEHVTIPIDMRNFEPIAKLLSYNLKDLLINNGPTYVHCQEGKDRTGMVIAMFRCRYMGWSCHDAIQEAKKIGFGLGLDPKVTKFYEKVICMSCEEKHDHVNLKHIDRNDADIAENGREESETTIDNADMKSFAPYVDATRNEPYSYSYDQYPTRNNIEKYENIKEDGSEGSKFPLVGQYDNNSGIKGSGIVDIGGGFVNT